MADNITLNSGSGGSTLATDDVAGVHYQIVKIGTGALDAVGTPVSDSNPMPIDDAGGSITVDGTVAVTQSGSWTVDLGTAAVTNAGTFAVQVNGSALTALQLIDDAVYTDGTGTPSKGFAIMGSDGTNPQFIATDTSGNVQVDLVTANVTNAGTFAVQVDSSALPTGAATAANQTSIIGYVDGIETLLGTIDADTSALAGTVSGGSVLVDLGANNDVTVTSGSITASLAAGTNNIGDVDILSIAAGTNVIGDVGISGARTSGGTTIFRSIDLDETEEEIKSTAGQVYWIHAMNLAATKRFLKFYNATAASVTVGTTTPVMTFALPTQGDTNGTGFTLAIPNGIAFGTAITVAATTGVADSDTGAPGANEVIVNIGYA